MSMASEDWSDDFEFTASEAFVLLMVAIFLVPFFWIADLIRDPARLQLQPDLTNADESRDDHFNTKEN